MSKPREIRSDDGVRVGAGTLGGEYLRCFWWPVALAEEVRDIPVPVKLLGEELVLFRDLSGRLTLLGAHCSHRRASLEYGIIQPDGIRCAYHGWCYDHRGRVVDRPAEPIKTAPNILHPWYPARELSGFVFAYLGKTRRVRRRFLGTTCSCKTVIAWWKEETPRQAKPTIVTGSRVWKTRQTQRI